MSTSVESAGPRPANRSLARKTGLSAIASAVASGGGLVANVAIARLLGATDAGVVAFAVWVSSSAVLLFGVGIPQALTRFIANETTTLKGPLRTWLVRSYGRMILGGAFALACAVVTYSEFGINDGVTWAIVVLFVAQAAASLDLAVAAGEQNFTWIARRNLVGAAVQVVGVVAGAAAIGPLGALLGYACGQAVMARRIPELFGNDGEAVETDARKEVLRFAATTWFAALLSLLTWSRLEFLFIGRFHAAREVAMYAAALSVVQLATQPVALLSGALLPHYSALTGRDPSLATSSYEASTRLLALVAFPLAFGVAATAPQVVHVLFGGAFDDAALPTTILAPVAGLGAVAAAGSSLVYATGRSRFIALSGLVVGGVAIATFAIAIPRYGVVGAAMARSAVQLLAVVAGMTYIGVRLKAMLPTRELALAAGSAGAASLPARLLGGFLGTGWLSLIAGAAVYASTYVLLVGVTRALRSDDAETLERIARRAPWPCAGFLVGWISWVRGR